MDDKFTSRANHLTEIDFDISGIKKSLEEVQEYLKETVQKIKTGEEYKINLSIGNISTETQQLNASLEQSQKKIEETKKVTESASVSFEKLGQAVQASQAPIKLTATELTSYEEKLKKTLQTSAEFSNVKFTKLFNIGTGELEAMQALVTHTDSYGKKITEVYKLNLLAAEGEKTWSKAKAETIDNLTAQAKAQEAAVKSQETAIKTQIKEAASLEKLTKTVDTLLLKIQQTNDVSKSLGQLEINTESYQEFNQLLEKFSNIKSSFETTGALTIVDEQEIARLKIVIDDLNGVANAQAKINKEIQAQEALNAKQINQVKDLKQRYEDLIKKIESYPSNASNVASVEKLKQGLEEVNAVMAKLENKEILDSGDLNNIAEYQRQLKSLSAEAQTANTRTTNFLQTITDKARWLAAFTLIMSIENAFRATLTTIIDTEAAVVELQRVLSQDVGTIAIQQGLIDIASTYGRTFDEVNDAAVKFAQTGATWNETLALTESTMLAVNTAELEVTTATTGLIAVMSQFNLESTEMLTVIDQINITADNFSVTSEKIVSALQRTGSAAVSANLSLEQTIAMITAMSEATGRSGEAIGTAINSLLVYTSKTSALDTFGAYIPETVELYKQGAVDIIQVWTDLSNKINSLTEEQQQAFAMAMADDSAYQEFADEIENTASEVADSVKEIYGTAGTYRQNYFIALLNNIETVEEAMLNMSAAEGYSIAENEKTMATLTRQLQVLENALKELAVTFGNAGALEFAKALVYAATGIVELVGALGGINTILAITAGRLIVLKTLATDGTPSKLATTLINLQVGIKSFVVSVGAAQGATAKLTVAFNALKASIGPVGIALLAINATYTIITSAIRKNNEAIQESIAKFSELTTNAQTQAQSLNGVQAQYNSIINSTASLSEKEKQLSDFKETLISQYGFETEAIKELNLEREKGIDLIDEEIKKQYDAFMAEVRSSDAYSMIEEFEETTQAVKKMGAGIKITVADYVELTDAYKDFGLELERTAQFFKGGGDLLFGYTPEAGEDTIASLEKLNTEIARLRELEIKGNISSTEETALTVMIELRNKLKDQTEEQIEVIENLIATEVAYAQSLVYSEAQAVKNATTTDEQTIALENLNTAIKDIPLNLDRSTDELLKWAETLTTSISSTDVLVGSLAQLQEQVEGLAEAYGTTASSVSDAQSVFETMVDIVTEYNSTGYLTLDMMKDLTSLSGEYASMLRFEGDQLYFVNQATGEVLSTKADLLKQMVIESTTTQIAQLAMHLYEQQLAEASGTAVSATNTMGTLANGIAVVTEQALKGEQSVGALANALNALVEGQGYNFNTKYQSMFNLGVESIINQAVTVFNQIEKEAESLDFWTGGALSDGVAAATASNSQIAIDALNDQIEAVENRYDLEIDYLKEVQDGIKANRDEALEALEARKDAIEELYNAEIDKLKEVEAENDRIRAKEDYLESLASAERDLASAAARSGVEYREEEFNINENIAGIEKDWLQQLEDWQIEDQIAELERLRDTAIESIEKQMALIEQMAEEKLSALDAQIAEIEARSEAEVNALKQQIADLESQMNGVSGSYVDGFAQASKDVLDMQGEVVDSIADEYMQKLLNPLAANLQKALANDSLINTTQTLAQAMYKTYDNQLLTPMYSSMQKIMEMSIQISAMQGLTSTSAIGTTSTAISPYSTNNNTQTNNVYLSVTGTSSATSAGSQINNIFSQVYDLNGYMN